MISIEPYRPNDLAEIRGREYEQEIHKYIKTDFSRVFATGIAYTIRDGGIAVAAGGVVELWNGVGEAWLHLSDWYERRPFTAYKLTRNLLKDVLRTKPYRRIQAPIRADMERNLRLVEHLGFQSEGILKYWGPEKADYIMYALVNHGERLCPA